MPVGRERDPGERRDQRTHLGQDLLLRSRRDELPGNERWIRAGVHDAGGLATLGDHGSRERHHDERRHAQRDREPGGADTDYYFQYGTTDAYGSTTSSTDAGSGTAAVSVSTGISGLASGKTYDYRVVATNTLEPATDPSRRSRRTHGRQRRPARAAQRRRRPSPSRAR